MNKRDWMALPLATQLDYILSTSEECLSREEQKCNAKNVKLLKTCIRKLTVWRSELQEVE